MSQMDDYRKGWAVRYLREAKAELIAARKTPYMATGFIMEALSKAQAALYYSLGDPAFIAPIIQEVAQSQNSFDEPVLSFLVEVEQTIQQLMQNPKVDTEKTMEHVNDILEFTSEIVNLFGCETS